MHIYIYVYIYTHIHIYIHVHKHLHICVCVFVRVFVRVQHPNICPLSILLAWLKTTSSSPPPHPRVLSLSLCRSRSRSRALSFSLSRVCVCLPPPAGVIIAIILSTKMGTPEAYPQNTDPTCNSLEAMKMTWPRVPQDGAGCQGTLYMKNLLFPAYAIFNAGICVGLRCVIYIYVYIYIYIYIYMYVHEKLALSRIRHFQCDNEFRARVYVLCV